MKIYEPLNRILSRYHIQMNEEELNELIKAAKEVEQNQNKALEHSFDESQRIAQIHERNDLDFDNFMEGYYFFLNHFK